MNPETVRPDSSDYTTAEVEQPEVVEINTDTKLLPPQTSATSSPDTQWQQYGEKIAAFLQALPAYVTGFFKENKGPLGTVGIIVLALVTVKLTLALLDAINDIPLVAPTLELIGLVYAGWFVYRYLLTAATRKELAEEINIIKNQILGTDS